MTFPEQERLGAWVTLVQVNQVVEAALEQQLRASVGVSLAEFEVLVRLSGTPQGRLKMIEIANLQLASKSGITRIVDRLVQDGLVSREVPPENRRIVYAAITPAGTEALRRGRAVFFEELERTFLRHLNESDVRALRRTLRKLLVGNGIWDQERCTFPDIHRTHTSDAAL
jgi:DNA-binding MarR family transcriptional regulator